jgi:hypothetical protein
MRVVRASYLLAAERQLSVEPAVRKVGKVGSYGREHGSRGAVARQRPVKTEQTEKT